MKEKIKTFFCILFLICVLPYLITICLKEKNQEPKAEETIADLPGEGDMDVENYLLGVLAAEISVNYEPETIKALARQTTMGRVGTAEDIQGLTMFLASPASDYITGQVIHIDGGWTAI